MTRGVELLLNSNSYFHFISSGLIEFPAGWVFPVPEENDTCVRLRLCLPCGTQTAAQAQRAEQVGAFGVYKHWDLEMVSEFMLLQ